MRRPKSSKAEVQKYFLLYCRAQAEKCPDTGLLLLGIINDFGYDVKEILGKWCLAKKEK